MKKRYELRPNRFGSATAVVVGFFMLVFGLEHFPFDKDNSGFGYLWISLVLVAIIASLLNVAGVGPAQSIIEQVDDEPVPDRSLLVSERLRALKELHRQKQITDEELTARRLEILRGI